MKIYRITIKTIDLKIKPKIYNEVNDYKFSDITYEESEINLIKDKTVQTCFSKNRNDSSDLKNNLYNIYITHNKFLMPCCMIPPYISNSLTNCSGYESSSQKEVLNRMVEIGVENFSLKNRTLREVMDSGVLNKFVYNDLENNKPFLLCKQHCGRCNI